MTTMNDNDRAILQDVARLAGHRSFFMLGWCTGRCDTIPPRAVMDDDAQQRLASRLTTDDRDVSDWKRGYRAGVAGSKNALLLALDRAVEADEFREGDKVEWQDTNGNWRTAIVVKGNLGGDWPSVRVTRLDGTEQVVAMTPKALRRVR